MFPSFPGFEEWPLHFDVEYEGRTRPVRVCIEQLPSDPPVAVPICCFVDAPDQGEWLLAEHTRIYTLGNLHLLRWVISTFRGVGVQPDTEVQWNPHRVQKLYEIVERALNASDDSINVLRWAQISMLPGAPHIAVMSAEWGCWCNGWKARYDTRFSAANFNFAEEGFRTQQWIEDEWGKPDSQVRFAWQWAQWSDEERFRRSCGWQDSLCSPQSEVEQVMKWMLTSSTTLWKKDLGWNWQLNQYEQHGSLQNTQYWNLQEDLVPCQEWLWSHFFAGWRSDWQQNYRCVQDFWQGRPVIEIHINEPPTMHEQLEARLSLHDWLETNAPNALHLLLS